MGETCIYRSAIYDHSGLAKRGSFWIGENGTLVDWQKREPSGYVREIWNIPNRRALEIGKNGRFRIGKNKNTSNFVEMGALQFGKIRPLRIGKNKDPSDCARKSTETPLSMVLEL